MKSIETSFEWDRRLASSFLPSRATLVVCPSHLCRQWQSEAKKTIPNAKVHLLATIIDHDRLTYEDVMTADLIIVSLNFLQNKSYLNKMKPWFSKNSYSVEQHMQEIKLNGPSTLAERKGCVVFQMIYWYRIVCDEFHELGATVKQQKAAKFFLEELQGAHYLGVTGTPIAKTVNDVVKQRIRRNVPNLNIPAFLEQIIWVELSTHEKALYHGIPGASESALMACNHHSLQMKF
jgi:SNF2 family DNA or RNA helicase